MDNKEKRKQYYIDNRERILKKSKQYYHDHKEERQRYNNEYWSLNSQKYAEKRSIDNEYKTRER
jgi:hypothetical protein